TATLASISLSLVACGTLNQLKTDDGLKRTSELWSDVPKMDGLSASKLEIPVYVKALMRAALNDICGRGGKNSGDWIVFDSTRTADDIRNFYNSDRMAASGWDKTDKSPCVSGSEYGAPQLGMVCVFGKHNGAKDVGLMIIPAQAAKAGAINLWFVRVEAPRDSSSNSVSTNSARTSDNNGANKNMGTTPAPYGIDGRPMPVGTNIDQLLPPQVGTYKREMLRSASSPNLKPDAAIGDSIYADYRSGDATIFVELGVTSSVNDAREALEAAAGDAAGGVFPTDPRFGARGQEPSYLKVIGSDGAFFAWTRGNYYFSVHAKRGESDLDAFMQAFGY